MAIEAVASATDPRTAIERLADFVAGASRGHSALALERSRLAVIDTIGCMLVGQDRPETLAALATVSQWGAGEAFFAGSHTRLAPPWAAFVNATAAHALDYDDWDDTAYTHTSAVLVPTILAATAGRQFSGVDLLDAHIIGVEVIMRIGEAVNPSHYNRGWHSTSTIGAIGCAAAVARIMKLDSAGTANALSLATSMAGGFLCQFGNMAKPLHAGLAAKAGVFAASLASNGATAASAALDGPNSFVTNMTDVTGDDFVWALDKLGDPWAIEEYGLHVKVYPACGGPHRVIEAALQIRWEHNLDADDIESIELVVPDFIYELLPYMVPNSHCEALFSFPYCVAVAFCRGKVGIEEFSPQTVTSKEVLELAGRVKIKSRYIADRTRLFFKGDYDEVTVTTRSGQILHAAVDIPYGAPPRFADAGTVEAKFRDCAGYAGYGARVEEILGLFTQSPADWSVEQLAGLLSPQTSES